MKKRITFDKYDDMRFISHLDLLRFLDRLLKKAHIPMKYSQGFHPRPKISLGNPVSLGTSAYNELVDIEIEDNLTNEEIYKRIKDIKIAGFDIKKVEDIIGKESIVELYTNAIYHIKSKEENINKLYDLLNQDTIIETKEKKGKVVERDLKERVINFKRDNNLLILELVNTSPNPYISLADIDIKDVEIEKKGYINNYKEGEL